MISIRFPSDHVYNRQVGSLPIHAQSADWVSRFFPMDRAFGVWSTGTYGLPIQVVGPFAWRFMTFDWAKESDFGLYPVPDNPAFDGPNTDQHYCAVDGDYLYEVYGIHPNENDHAACGAKWGLRSNKLRKEGWTSSSESGLPWSPAAIRYDEAHTQQIRHALLFSLSWPAVANSYVWPARHVAVRPGVLPNAIPLGTRLRLRGDYVVPPGMSIEAGRILSALRDYGAFLSDRNGDLSVPSLGLFKLEAEPSASWGNRLQEIEARTVGIAEYIEFVDESAFQYAPDSGRWKL